MVKYIIQIEEEPLVRKSALHGETAVYKAAGFNTLVFDKNGLDKLTPFEVESTQADNKDYFQGLDDAYKIITKILNMNSRELSTLLGYTPANSASVINTYSIKELSNLVKPYDNEHQVSIGDEVITEYDKIKAVVLDEADEDGVYYVITENGCVEKWDRNLFDTTGEHYDQVNYIVHAMQ